MKEEEKRVQAHVDVDVHDLSRTKELLYHHLQDDVSSHSLGNIYLDLGRIYSRIRNYPLAHEAWEKASGCFADPKAPLELATTYYQQGLLFLEERKAMLALEKWEMALEVLKDDWQGGSLLKCQVIYQMGKCLREQGNLEGAKEFLESGILLAQRFGNYTEEVLSMRELARVFFKQSNVQVARKIYYNILHKWKTSLTTSQIAEVTNDLGYLYNEQKDYRRAISAFRYSLRVQREQNDPGLFETLLQLGRLYLSFDPEQAKGYCQEAIERLLDDLTCRFNEAQEKRLAQVYYIMALYCREKSEKKNLLMFCRQSLQIYKKHRMEAQWNEVYQLYSKYASDQIQYYSEAWELINKLPQHEKLRLHTASGEEQAKQIG